mmetsp:Transcript_57373/g.112946  ORF Transcript_57373/g.112946 Transcript_57373/m.112946 type:complete len:249 (+) Transcript_57373:171-917(+)
MWPCTSGNTCFEHKHARAPPSNQHSCALSIASSSTGSCGFSPVLSRPLFNSVGKSTHTASSASDDAHCMLDAVVDGDSVADLGVSGTVVSAAPARTWTVSKYLCGAVSGAMAVAKAMGSVARAASTCFHGAELPPQIAGASDRRHGGGRGIAGVEAMNCFKSCDEILGTVCALAWLCGCLRPLLGRCGAPPPSNTRCRTAKAGSGSPSRKVADSAGCTSSWMFARGVSPPQARADLTMSWKGAGGEDR